MIWCSNDYLGMGQHPKVIRAMIETAARMGTGAGGTRNISGTTHPLVELERELVDLHGKEAALVFTSGYVSNESGISTIAKLLPNCLILSDALNHNSMIEGIRRSGAEKKIWRHNEVAHLEELLAAEARDRPKLIVFDSGPNRTGPVAPWFYAAFAVMLAAGDLVVASAINLVRLSIGVGVANALLLPTVLGFVYRLACTELPEPHRLKVAVR